MTVRAISLVLGVSLLAGSAARAAEPSVTVHKLAPVMQSTALPVATDMRLGGDDKQTRFVVDLTQKIDVATFTLADPYRVVIDLPQVTFKLSTQAGEKGRGLVKAFRYGLIMQGGSRIVLDTKGPVRVDKAFTLAAVDDQPARLVIDLTATDRAGFLRNIAMQEHNPHAAAKSISPAPEATGDARPLIVIDPGHGGIDSGTKSGAGQDEKDIVLAFGLMVRDRLEKTGKYRVAMTRSDDTFIPLTERVQIRARAQGLAVHLDPRRFDPAQRRAGRGRLGLYAVRPRLRRRGRAARRNRKQIRRHRRRRSHLRAQRRRQYPDRSRPARDQGVLAAVRPKSGR